mmetsp:Transcript_39375/g.103272  ORF Transcript_39375/g.103272 Transcript_39375/m.103272 type:complete len:215 (+) Transcript_39375:158-802(+)
MMASPMGTAAATIAKHFVPRAAVECHLWSALPGIAYMAGAIRAVARGTDARLQALRAKAEATAVTARAHGLVDSSGSTTSTQHPSAEVALPAFPQTECIPEDGLLRLYDVCHSRAGDKGNTANVSLIAYEAWAPHFDRIVAALTPDVLAAAFAPLADHSAGTPLTAQIYRMEHLAAINIVLHPVLDGGVSVSRRVDIHGKSFSDLLLGIQIRVR